MQLCCRLNLMSKKDRDPDTDNGIAEHTDIIVTLTWSKFVQV